LKDVESQAAGVGRFHEISKKRAQAKRPRRFYPSPEYVKHSSPYSLGMPRS